MLQLLRLAAAESPFVSGPTAVVNHEDHPSGLALGGMSMDFVPALRVTAVPGRARVMMPGMNRAKPRPTKPLYHYTSNAGLIGITQERAFWASNSAYPNDAADYEYPRQLFKEVLKRELVSAAIEERKLFDSARRLLCDFRYVPNLVSFSEKRDLLSQWRAYCPPGEGVSVGIRSAELARAARRQQFELVACIYDDRAQRRLIRQMARAALSSYRKRRAARVLTRSEAYPFAGRLAVEFFRLAHLD